MEEWKYKGKEIVRFSPQIAYSKTKKKTVEFSQTL